MSDTGQTNGHAAPLSLEGLTVAELRHVIAAAEAAIVAKAEETKADLLDRLERLKAEAAEAGLSLKGVLGATAAPAATPQKTRRRRSDAGTTLEAKYLNPETGKIWSGKGRVPKWIAGKNREDFRIGA